ncbi:hypothetical protein I3271_04490 [Photobacterium leiognathi]|uniref:hypothetical protein n=1 Tax=Photobacterium leiognathi TaxID=553611 RepID=UPI001EDD0EB8|nr:hypothetical protein [Photobacterium leiognathi]MCG3883942.1 hypothetical protein [Photobacterium leiognathi]
MSNVTLFVDAAFDNFIYAAGGGIWVKTGGRTLSKNVLIDDVRDSCEAEFKVLNKGIKFASSHHWFCDTSRIIVA